MKNIISNGTHYNVFPNCNVNIQSEIGEMWGGLEAIFSQKQLEKDIHTVTVSLYDKHDNDGYYNNDENDLLILDGQFKDVFGFSLDGENFGGVHDAYDNTYWFTNIKNARSFAKCVKKNLVEKGFIVRDNQK